MSNFETQISIQKLKTANNITDMQEAYKTAPEDLKQEISTTIRELNAYYKGLEYAQELYYSV